MNYERSKAPLALMEQIIMILVFAPAHAQEVIEMCKACAGDWQKVVGEMPGQIEGDTLEIPFEQDHMTVQMIKTDADEYLTNAKVTVFDEDKEEIYHVAAAWQRGGTS